LQLHPRWIAAQSRFVRPQHKVSQFVILATRDRLERHIVPIEMIDQAFAPMRIVLEPLIEPGLLEHDAVMDAGHVGARARLTSAHRLMIGFLVARKRCEQIVADGTNIELVEMPALRWRH
jgi:hypothetical protein